MRVAHNPLSLFLRAAADGFVHVDCEYMHGRMDGITVPFVRIEYKILACLIELFFNLCKMFQVLEQRTNSHSVFIDSIDFK